VLDDEKEKENQCVYIFFLCNQKDELELSQEKKSQNPILTISEGKEIYVKKKKGKK
ncbi:10442_t:CDS:2, partial [Cetraspora pellucida]